MDLPLSGKRIALAECRQVEVFAQMFEKEGATAIRYPLVAILDAVDPAPVLAWIRELITGKFDYVVFLTGEGVRRLKKLATAEGISEEFLAALARTKLITRGPKPVAALKDLGLAPYKVAEKPTSEGLMATLSKEDLAGKTVGVQWYNQPTTPIVEGLTKAGATLVPVTPYHYAPETDDAKVIELIEGMNADKFDLFVITSSPQMARLFEVAKEKGLEAELKSGLSKTPIAAVGPIAADSVKAFGLEVAIMPEQGFVMKNLVQHIKRKLTE